MEVLLDKQRFITTIAKDPANDKEAADLKAKGFIEVHPLKEWLPYMADFANKFYVDENGVMKAPGNLPVTALQKAFTAVKQQLSSANESITSLKSANADLVKQMASVTNDNKQLANDAAQSKQSAQQAGKVMSNVMGEVFELKAQLAKNK